MLQNTQMDLSLHVVDTVVRWQTCTWSFVHSLESERVRNWV